MFKLFSMKAHIPLALVPILFFAGFLTNSLASTFYTSFTIGGLPVSNGNAAPTDPVSGTIVWTAQDIHSAIQSFVSVSLTLDGHSYSVPELGFFSFGPGTNQPDSEFGIGGTLNGA